MSKLGDLSLGYVHEIIYLQGVESLTHVVQLVQLELLLPAMPNTGGVRVEVASSREAGIKFPDRVRDKLEGQKGLQYRTFYLSFSSSFH